jgi:chemotaxis protein MotB
MSGNQGHIPGVDEDEGGHENHERWLLTYADMITLLVAFFMMLYSMSVMNLQKFQEVAISIKSGFGGEENAKRNKDIIGVENSSGVMPIKVENKVSKNESRVDESIFAEVKQQISDLIVSKKLQNIMDVKMREGNIYIVLLTDKIFFPQGDAILTDDAKAILKDVGQIIEPLKKEISVEGFTASVPPDSVKFRSNWELSAARSITVINYFTSECSIEQKRMSLTGYGEWRPYFETELSSEKNDRVAIAILKKDFKGGK